MQTVDAPFPPLKNKSGGALCAPAVLHLCMPDLCLSASEPGTQCMQYFHSLFQKPRRDAALLLYFFSQSKLKSLETDFNNKLNAYPTNQSSNKIITYKQEHRPS